MTTSKNSNTQEKHIWTDGQSKLYSKLNDRVAIFTKLNVKKLPKLNF